VAGVYSLLNWLLVASTGFIPLDEAVAKYWLPGAVSWVLVIIFVQPGLRLMKDDKKGNLSFFYHVAAVAVVAVPAMIAQGYVAAVSGGMTHLSELNEIGSAAHTKYYSVDSVCVERAGAIVHPAVRITGKNRTTLVFDVYALMPACHQRDLESGAPRVWISAKFHESHSASMPRSEQETRLADFVGRSSAEFRRRDTSAYLYFARLGRNSDRKEFEAALRSSSFVVDPSAEIVLIPHLEPYQDRAGDSLQWTFISFGIATVVWLIAVLLRPLDRRNWRRRLRAREENRDHTGGMLAVLIPNRQAYGLALLVDTNILVFVMMVMSGLGLLSFDSDDLLRWGANYRPALHDVGLLRLVTSQFVHNGVMHLVGNLYGLLMAGIFLAPVVRNAGLLCCYLLTGLGGSLASAYMKEATISVGASGAIFGLFGVLLVLLLLRDQRIAPMRQFILLNCGFFVGINLLIGAFSHGIDNAAHVGGLVVGGIVGVVLYVWERHRFAGGDESTQTAPASKTKP
jgi:membrane associated rhomboid family serine protease